MGRNSMTHHRYELPIPGPAAENKDAREILRIWGAGGKPCISIDTEGEGGPASELSSIPTARRCSNGHSTGSRGTRSSRPAEWAQATTTRRSSRWLPDSAGGGWRRLPRARAWSWIHKLFEYIQWGGSCAMSGRSSRTTYHQPLSSPARQPRDPFATFVTGGFPA